MSDSVRQIRREMTCDEVSELAGLYVLGALEADEHEAVASHLVACQQAHDEVRELGSVVPALALLAQPIDAPAGLKARVLDAVGREAALAASSGAATSATLPARSTTLSAEPARPTHPVRAPMQAAWRPPAWASWGAAMAAVLVLAVTGVWALGVQQRADDVEGRAAVLAEAIAAFSAPDSAVAILRDSGNPDTSGFAAISAEGRGYVVIIGLPVAPAGQTYQAWYFYGDLPVSAGLLTVDADGYAVLADGQAAPGAQAVALTKEPEGGSAQPTSEPFVLGDLRPA